ncbi:MAG: pectate lyase [Blastopirellula sp.]|nr:MAG: pectate lyase [Blastopirellula sp.]
MILPRIAALLFFLSIGIASGQDTETIAFPGAEGYGRFAKGGRGGDVYIVTNLNDDGEGSLRNGIENMSGPRTIVFAVSGTIALKSEITIKRSYLTIAGQTAPGDGICLKDYGLKFDEVNDIIMRYIRVRMGDQNKGASSGADCITSSKISDVIFDHISAGWGIDAIHDNRVGGHFTLQWSIYGETLHDTIHYEGASHSKLGSFRETTKNISIHHNLLHSTFARHPSMGGAELTPEDLIIDFRNNLIYNSGGQTNLGAARRNVINNYYKKGPDTKTGIFPLRVKAKPGKGPTPRGFVSGNVFTWNPAWTDDNFSAIQYLQDGDKYLSTTQEIWELPGELVHGADKPATDTAKHAYRKVLKYAGASKSRDACDKRIINEVKTSTGKVPDSQDEVGGWPTLKSLPAPTDADKDGMADAWETANGLNPNDAKDRNDDRDSDGFTNLEEYINSLTQN